MIDTIYLADKELAYCEVLDKNSVKFKSYIRYLLYSFSGTIDKEKGKEVYQQMCYKVWEKLIDDSFEFTLNNIERTFIGMAKYIAKKICWRHGTICDSFSNLDSDDGILFSDSLAFDVNDEMENEVILKYNFLESVTKELSITEQSFLTCYLENDCSLIKTIRQLGDKKWNSSNRLQTLLSKIRGKIKDPILIEMMQESRPMNNKDIPPFDIDLTAIRYDIALEKGLDLISRPVGKLAAKTYRSHYLAFVKSVEELFGDTRYTLNNFKTTCYRLILEDLQKKVSHKRYLSLCQCIRSICKSLLEKGYISENTFWLTYKDYHDIKTRDKTKTDEKVHLVREWAMSGLSKLDIYSKAREVWPGISPTTVYYALQIVMAEGSTKKDMRSLTAIKEERVNIVAGWLQNPDFKVESNFLTSFTADYFKASITAAVGYVKGAKDKIGQVYKTNIDIEAERTKFIIDNAEDFTIEFKAIVNKVAIKFQIALCTAQMIVNRVEESKCRKFTRSDNGSPEKERRIAKVCEMLAGSKMKFGELKIQVASEFGVTNSCAEKYIFAARKKISVA